MVATRGVSLRQEEGTILTDTTTLTIVTASLHSPQTSPIVPTQGLQSSWHPKYDGKQDPCQWIRCYSVTIKVSSGSNSTKALYFPVALESTPLTWLESLKPNSIDSWDHLKRAFIDNFQGSMIQSYASHHLQHHR
jgi:hypothetical protein